MMTIPHNNLRRTGAHFSSVTSTEGAGAEDCVARRAWRGLVLAGVALVSVGCSQDAVDSVPGTTEVTSSAAPEDASRSFGSGTHRVGEDIAPGTYRAANVGDSCYWERLSGFTGDVDDIIANDNAQGAAIVTILPSDKGFTSRGCGTWELLDDSDAASGTPTPANATPAHATPANADPKQQQQASRQQPAPAAPAQQPAADGPIGFTGDPNRETPKVLSGKQIASCLSTSDPSSYQPGTTLFTDGTTGWTAECAAQYVPPAPSGGNYSGGADYAAGTADAYTDGTGAGFGDTEGDY